MRRHQLSVILYPKMDHGLKRFNVANILTKCTIIQGCNHGKILGEAKPMGGPNLPPLVEIGLTVNIAVHGLLYLKIWVRQLPYY